MTRAALALALGLAACGVKAPPRPPERHAAGARPEPAALGTTASTCERCPPTPTPTSTPTPTPTPTPKP